MHRRCERTAGPCLSQQLPSLRSVYRIECRLLLGQARREQGRHPAVQQVERADEIYLYLYLSISIYIYIYIYLSIYLYLGYPL